jgi:hypothetical protein
MTDSEWIRSYNGKKIFCSSEIRANTMSTEAGIIVGGNLRVFGDITFGQPGAEYTLNGNTDGLRIVSGPNTNDSQRLWFKRNPGQRNV